jgi:hypothetical protein
MNEDKKTKRTAPTTLKFVNRTRCAERVAETAKLKPGVVAVWRMLLDMPVTYTKGTPVREITKRFEAEVQNARDVSSRAVALRTIAANEGLDHLVDAALAILADEGLVRLGTDQRKRYDAATNEFVLDTLPWVWPLPVEAWPETHFLAAIALRLDPTTKD